MGKLHSKGLPEYRERERTTERGRVRKAPREKEKYPRPAIVHSLARLRQLEQQAQKETLRPYINHSNCRNRQR